MINNITTVIFFGATIIAASASAQTDTAEYRHCRFGGYGEMLYQHMNYGADRYKDPAGAQRQNRASVSMPRMILALDCKFRNDVVLGTEIEFEYGGTGTAMELEYDEAGEYEMEIEKAGEVVLEQSHITKRFATWLNIRAGHMIVPVGLTNAHHEPVFFFGTTRPEGEVTILPCTWHETGIAILGTYNRFRYELMVINGLDPNGFSSSGWIHGGKQKLFETASMTSPAFSGRLEYKPVTELRTAVSMYYNRSANNASIPQKTADINATVAIISADAQYWNRNAAIRANIIYGHLTDALRLSHINRNLSKATQFARTPVAEAALTYSVEAGYNILSLFDMQQVLIPFARYEYYNSAEKVPSGMAEMPINKRDVFTVGINYAMLPNIMIKADYSVRRIDRGNFNSEHTFGIALAYTGWFMQL